MRREYNKNIVIPDGLVFWAPLTPAHGFKDLVSGNSFASTAYGTIAIDSGVGAAKVTRVSNAIYAPCALISGLDMNFGNQYTIEYDVLKGYSGIEMGLGVFQADGNFSANYINATCIYSGTDTASQWVHKLSYIDGNNSHYRIIYYDGVAKPGAGSTSYTGDTAYLYSENFTVTHRQNVSLGNFNFTSGYFWIKNIKIWNLIKTP